MTDHERIAELAARARRGDRAAFAALVERLARPLMGYFGLRGLSPELAEECVQETFLRAYESLSTYTGGSPFQSWVYGIARNVHLQHARQRERHRHEDVLEAAVVGGAPDPAARSDDEERLRAVREAIAGLPERMQLALQLRFVERRSCEEIAEALGTTVAAVSPLLYRAKAALRERLEGRASHESRGP